MADPLVEVSDLAVEFHTPRGVVRAVDGVSFRVARGEILGVVGESGSGKSVSSLAILGLLERPSGRITRGSIRFDGQTISNLGERELRRLRGDRMSMIFQDPLTSLNPYLTIEEQLIEVLEFHRGTPRAEARQRCLELLTQVGISEPAERLKSHPHQLSGGMRQRVCIAMALLCDPSLLIADEPTTMLDVTIQAQILDLVRSLRKAREMSILFITHDLGVISELCERVIVIHKGTKIYDGALARLENAGGAKKKIITFVPALAEGAEIAAFPDSWQSRYGTTIRAPDGKFTLRVPGEQVVAVSQEVLSTGPVADITIEDVPLEDVIAELFSAQG